MDRENGIGLLSLLVATQRTESTNHLHPHLHLPPPLPGPPMQASGKTSAQDQKSTQILPNQSLAHTHAKLNSCRIAKLVLLFVVLWLLSSFLAAADQKSTRTSSSVRPVTGEKQREERQTRHQKRTRDSSRAKEPRFQRCENRGPLSRARQQKLAEERRLWPGPLRKYGRANTKTERVFTDTYLHLHPSSACTGAVATLAEMAGGLF